MAPVLSFTANEAWETLNGGAASVFEQTWYQFPLPRDAARHCARAGKSCAGCARTCRNCSRNCASPARSAHRSPAKSSSVPTARITRSSSRSPTICALCSSPRAPPSTDGKDGAALPVIARWRRHQGQRDHPAQVRALLALPRRRRRRCRASGYLRALRRQSARRRRAARVRMTRWLALSALLVVLDQLSKFALTRALARCQHRSRAVLQSRAGLQPGRCIQLSFQRFRLAARIVHRDRADRVGVGHLSAAADIRVKRCSALR